MVYLDFRSLCLIIAMRRTGRRLLPDSCRFTLSLNKGCLAAIVAALRGGGAGGGGGLLRWMPHKWRLEVEMGGGGGGGGMCAVQFDRKF
jgi:hypothetical protein